MLVRASCICQANARHVKVLAHTFLGHVQEK
jgi:hypothetical protein